MPPRSSRGFALVRVAVGHSGSRFTGQAGNVVVVDVGVLRVEQVKDVEGRFPRLAEFVPELQIHERGGGRLLAGVLNQDARAEIAEAHSPVEAAQPRFAKVMNGNAGIQRRLDGFGHPRADRIMVRKAGVGICEIQIERQPRRWRVKVGQLHTPAAAGAARLVVCGIAVKDQLAVQVKNPEHERALQAGQEGVAHADLCTLGFHQRADAAFGCIGCRRWAGRPRRECR